MDFAECSDNFKYIRELLNLLEDLKAKAVSLAKEQELHNTQLDRKYLKLVWNLQVESVTELIHEQNNIRPPSSFQKFVNIFIKKHREELYSIKKLNKFCSEIDDENLSSENKIDLIYTNLEFLSLRSYNPSFETRITEIIEDCGKYPAYTKKFHIYPKHIPILKTIKTEYLKESIDFMEKDLQNIFDEYIQERTALFEELTNDVNNNSLFQGNNYKPKKFTSFLKLTDTNFFDKTLTEINAVYKLIFDNYKAQLDEKSNLTYGNLVFSLKHKSPLSLLEDFDPKTMVFKEYNALSHFASLFNYYPQAIDDLGEILLEMKKKHMIPDHLDKYYMSIEKEFGPFYKKISEKFNLHKELDGELEHKEAPVRKKLIKV